MSEAVPADASGRDSGLTAPTGDTPVGPRPRADRSPAPPAVPGGAAAPPGQSDPGALGPRATRTREAIVATARALFLDRGYAGTSVADITEACGISRAGFYTYFRHKREIFEELGRTSYQANLAVVERLGALASDWTVPQIRLWVVEYFAYMDIHGAFVLAAGMSAPTDTQFRADRVRTQLRVARILGRTVQANRPAPAGPPEAIGLVLVAMLEQAWYQLRVLRAPVAEHEVVEALAGIVAGTRTTPDG